MAIKFEKIQPGMILLDIHREHMGNTTMCQWSMWKVEILAVNKEERTAVVSWNGNPARVYSERKLTRLYTKPTKAYRDQQERRKNGH